MTETTGDEGATLAASADMPDAAVPGAGRRLVPLVGLGGSAGAIGALQRVLEAVPVPCAMAFVVVIHLDATLESTLAEILQRSTTLRVQQVRGTLRVEPGTVYVIPPGKAIKVGDGVLRLHDDALHDKGRHVAVDLFFRTLADTHGAHAAAVVLSGADGDGTLGLKRIKERGGLTVAQDPAESDHAGMPRSAIATGMVDWVLPAGDIPARLAAYFAREKTVHLPPDAAEGDGNGRPSADDEASLREVTAFLRTRTGRDFSAYKRATLVRRIGRRMQVNGTDTLPGYLACLRTQPGEAAALVQDLLISVTNFFRDAECFDALVPHLAALVRTRRGGEPVRVWVPGCATGEEAYTLAILLCEQCRELESPPLLQVFASDLSEEAIRTARAALYPPSIEADVSVERLRRYFVREHRGWRVRREIREMVLFAQHDVLHDSPFSRLDLVSCRNLLIYLNRPAQQRVFDTFHFALVPHGVLFLGSSESLDETNRLFAILDKKNRIYAQRPQRRSAPPQIPLAPALAVRPEAPAIDAGPPAIGGRGFPLAPLAPRADPEAGAGDLRPSAGDLHLKLLELIAPPSILVDAGHEIVHLSAHAGRYLQFGGGEPSRNLLRSLHPALRAEVRAALFQAAQNGQASEALVHGVPVGAASEDVAVRVVPAAEPGNDFYLVLLAGHAGRGAQPAPAVAPMPVAEPVERHLDRELERLKQHLRYTVEQYEASTEELKASNEELQAMNEELRSATEELETSREELQSINEELSTVNQELKNKVDELAHANSDILNLMDATEIATVFLDRDLRVMRYTPAAVQLFSLIPTDVGRPLADLAARVQYPGLSDDAQRVLQRLAPIEHEVGLPEGRWFLTRLLPYRTTDDRIAGVVLSFIDITERKRSEEVRLWLSAVVNASTDAIVSFSLDGTVLSWNGGAEQVFGYSAAECIGLPLSVMAPGPEQQAEMARHLGRLAAGESLRFESVRRHKDGTEIQVAMSVSPIRDATGTVIGGTSIARDVTDARRAAEALRRGEERLRLIVENARDFAIFAMDLERRVTSWNSGAQRLLGFAEHEALGMAGDSIFTAQDRAAGAPEREARTTLDQGRAADERWHQRKDGSLFWASGVCMSMRDSSGRAVGLLEILRDQTEAREAQERLERSQAELVAALAQNQQARADLEAADAAKDQFLALLSHELRNPLSSIASATELLSMQGAGTEQGQRALQILRRQARAMKAMLHDLLDVSRLRLGKLEVRKRPVTLAQVVEPAIESVQPLIEAGQHQLSLRLPAHDVELDADPLRLGQVLANLLGNAAKYTGAGGHIGLDVQLDGGQLVMTVSDDGMGMAPQEIERMFDLFAQAEQRPPRANDGLGIGLALARSIVQLHGGTIRAESPGLGGGSRFIVSLPVLRAGAPVGPAAADPGGARTLPPGARVLVVDDNLDAAWALGALLRIKGAEVSVAASGAEALAVAQREPPGYMVVDIGMPGMSGHEVARQVRAQPWGARVVLVAATGWGQDADVRASLAAGFDAHLTKPLDAVRLVDLLADVARRRAAPGTMG